MNSLLIKGYATETKGEIWKDIPGYEHIYEASNYGNIRTCKNKFTVNKKGIQRFWKQRIIKQKICRNKKGRCDSRVELWKDGNHKTFLTARLIAITFCPNFFEESTVNHINGDSLDNRAENLEWITLKENIQKGFDNGLYSTCKKIRLIDEGGLYIDFNSMSSASRYLQKYNGYISNLINDKKEYCKSKEGEIFRIEVL